MVFVADLAVKLWLLSFLRLAQLGRVLAVARVLASSYRTAGTARQLVRSRGLPRRAELHRDPRHRRSRSSWTAARTRRPPHLGGALLWSAATVLGMFATVNPTTTADQLVMVGGFLAGLVLITTLAGTLGSYLLPARAESAPSTPTRQTIEQPGPAPGATDIEES